MNEDTINNEFYNQYYDHFDQVPFEKELLPLIEKYLPSQCEVLEIGSGAGALALWMTSNGFKVTCIEPAQIPERRHVQEV